MKKLKTFEELNEGADPKSRIKSISAGEGKQIIKEVGLPKDEVASGEQVLFEIEKRPGFVTIKQPGADQKTIAISDSVIDAVLDALNKFQENPKYIKYF